jgi:NNP family nitrate/nitrite transporter-like MFS transporter
MSILFSLGAAAVVGIYNILPLYLTTVHGFETASANMVVALSRIPGVGMVLVAGWFTDFIGPRKAMAAVLACSGVLSIMIGTLSGSFLVIVIFFQGAIATCFFTAGLASISKLFSFEMRNLAIAIAGAFSGFVGSGLVPAGIGLLADQGMFGPALVFNGILILTGVPMVFFLKFKDRPEA